MAKAERWQVGGSKRDDREPGSVYWDETRGVWSASIDLPREPGEPRRRVRRSGRTEAEAHGVLQALRFELATTGTIQPIASNAAGWQRRKVTGGWQIKVPGGWCAVSLPDPARVPPSVRDEMRAVHEAVRALSRALDADPGVTVFEAAAIKIRDDYQGAKE